MAVGLTEMIEYSTLDTYQRELCQILCHFIKVSLLKTQLRELILTYYEPFIPQHFQNVHAKI